MRLVYLLFILFCMISGLSFAQTFSIEDKVFSAKFTGSYYEFNQAVTDIDKAYLDYKNKVNITEYKKIKRKYSKKPLWLAFTVKNSFPESIERIIQFPFGCTDEMELFIFDSKGNYKKIQKKYSTPLKEREFAIRRLSASLSFKANEEKLIIAKLKSYHQVSANFDIYSKEQAYTYEENYKIISILYVGIALGLFLYNFFIGVSSKKKSIYLYMGTLFLLSTLIIITADISAYFSVVIPEFLHKTLPFHRALLISMTTFFTLSFLNIKEILPKTNTFFNIFATYTIVIGGCSFFDQYYQTINVILKNLMTINLVLILGLSLYVSIKSRSRPAFLFTLATASLFISGIVYMLTWSFGIIPRNFMTANVILLGSAIEMILFSLAIADSFQYEISKQLSKKHKIENELKNLNRFLEMKVKEKTDELLASKKRAALGEMASGVAHEMNSPLSAVYNNLQYLTAILSKDKQDIDCDKVKTLTGKSKRIVSKIFEITQKLKSFGESYGDLSIEMVDVSEVIKSVINSFGHSETNKKIHFSNEKSLYVNTYREHLYNALLSLMSVSARLNQTIYISVNLQKDMLEFELTGANKVVPTWIKNYLEIPFYEHSGEVKGSGLDLSMIKDAIEGMEGKIIVSNGKENFIFKIQIPYKREKLKKVA